MENKAEVWVVKDEEGILRPQAGIWRADSEIYSQVAKEEWDTRLSKKSHNKNNTLVRATLTENVTEN